MPIHIRARTRRVCRGGAPPWGSAAREVHRRDVPATHPFSATRSAACSATPAPTTASRVSVQGTGMGCPGATIVFEEARPARLQESDPCRHLRRPADEPPARRSHRRAERGACGLDRDASRRRRAALSDRVLERSSTRRCISPSSVSSRSTSARSSRATSSTTPTTASMSAGLREASSPSRWRRQRSSRWGRSAASRPACLLTVSDIVVEGVFTRITDEELRAAVDRMTTLALDVAVARVSTLRSARLAAASGERRRPSSSSIRRAGTGRPGGAGPRSSAGARSARPRRRGAAFGAARAS